MKFYGWISKKVDCLKGIKCKLDMCKKSEYLWGKDLEKMMLFNLFVLFLCFLW